MEALIKAGKAHRRDVLEHRYCKVDHHYSIISRYNTINHCLKHIKHSRIPTVVKLRIETMLIRVKILLLDEAPHHPVHPIRAGEAVFHALLERVQGMSGGRCGEEECAGLSEEVAGLLRALGSDPDSFCSYSM